MKRRGPAASNSSSTNAAPPTPVRSPPGVASAIAEHAPTVEVEAPIVAGDLTFGPGGIPIGAKVAVSLDGETVTDRIRQVTTTVAWRDGEPTTSVEPVFGSADVSPVHRPEGAPPGASQTQSIGEPMTTVSYPAKGTGEFDISRICQLLRQRRRHPSTTSTARRWRSPGSTPVKLPATRPAKSESAATSSKSPPTMT